MNCPKCTGANFGWAKKCDHCGFVFADESASQALSTRLQQLLESNLPVNRDGLQFDHVVTESGSPAARGGAGVVCSACRELIPDEYYEVNTNIVCQRCRVAVEAAAATPTGAGPFITAALCGFGACIAGALIYFAVFYVTHFQIGIVSILIGYMVGYTVRHGAGGRGGRRFQAMAAALTYGSVALAYLPIVVISSVQASQTVQHSSAAAGSGKTIAHRPPQGQPRSPVAGFATLLAFVAVLPILVVLGSFPSGLISGFIILIGLRQAWRMTEAVTPTVFGPYKVGTVLQAESS